MKKDSENKNTIEELARELMESLAKHGVKRYIVIVPVQAPDTSTEESNEP